MLEPNRQIDQWDRMESPEIDPHKHSQLISDKGAKALCFDNGAKINKWCWNYWTCAKKRGI